MELPAGTRLGPYEILSLLGAGGMGEVYRARDARLAREVAIKLLPEGVASDPARLARFEQEARAASRLNHPNIVTIHDVGSEGGRAFFAMELVDGESLRSRMAAGPAPPEEVARIGAQIAGGLAKAHAAGLVHRDLKPENVMISADGFVKILDFGLAKLAGPEASGAASLAETAEQRTAPGTILGTVGYMSPEQASGRPIDHRSDQFALGAILYELASEKKAFQRGSIAETFAALMREEPPPLASVAPAVPPALSRIVARCLEKRPEERFDSTRDLARELQVLAEIPSEVPGPRGAGRARLAPRRFAAIAVAAAILLGVVWWVRTRRTPSAASRGASVAVLPFQILAGGAADDYFADGMTDSLITDLARVPGLLVIARNSSFAYKGRSVDVKAVGDDLKVHYVLEGSLQRAGDAVRVNAQLIDAATGYHVWAEKYDRPMRDVFTLQDDISRSVAGALRATLGGTGNFAPRTPTSNLEAYDLFLRGRYYFQQYDWVAKDKSIPLFERAVALDPGFAAAHAMLAVACAKKAFEEDPEGTWRAKASAEIEKAMALDPDLPEAYVARGQLVWVRENGFPHAQAVADFGRALQLNGNFAEARAQLAGVYYHIGLLEEALEQYRLTLKIDPRNFDAAYRIPRIHLYQQRYAESVSGFDASPLFANDFLKPIALDHLGRREEALRFASRGALSNPTHSRVDESADIASTRAVLFARAGDRAAAAEEIAAAIRRGEGRSHFHHAAYNIATAYALLGKTSDALAWLQKTADGGMPCYPLFEKDPYLDALRSEPAFGDFLARRRAQWAEFRRTLVPPPQRAGLNAS